MKRHKPTYPPQQLLDERQAWGLSQPRVCQLCRRPERYCFPPRLEINEMVRRSQSPHHWADSTSNYLLLCQNPCHAERFANITVAPLAVQWAFKRIVDPLHYDYEALMTILGRGPQCVTPEEIEIAYRAFVMTGFGLKVYGGAAP